MPDTGSGIPSGRLVAVVAAAVIAVAFIGVATGIQPDRYEAKRPPPLPVRDMGNVPPARSHAELADLGWPGAPGDAAWRAAKATAREAAIERSEPSESVEDALAERAQLRAYDGAPPVVPHPVRAGGSPECVACHMEGFALAGKRASLIPHATFQSCTQCHVSSAPSLAADGSGPQLGENTFVGLAAPEGGAVAYEGAPPVVPHPTWMREECNACHGEDGRHAIRTPHPGRLSCLQCHAPISERGPFAAAR